MEQQIRIARMVSARLIRFYEARRIVGKLIYTTMKGDAEIVPQLKKTSDALDVRIKIYENEVKSSIESLPGFNKEKHIAPVFISQVDTDNEVIDISKKLDLSALLDVRTGEIFLT